MSVDIVSDKINDDYAKLDDTQLAAVLDGINRTDAARIGGMDRQTLRDWVNRFNDQRLIAALTPLLDAIPVTLMREANARAGDGKTSAEEAAMWLGEKIGKK